jgi:hypothetical protein
MRSAIPDRCLERAAAGPGNRDPRGGELHRHEDRGGDFADRVEIRAPLAEVDREAVDLGCRQGFGDLAQSILRKRWI